MVDVRYVKVKPREWPQDKAAPPNGYGGMSRIDFDNEHNVRQEAFIYGATEFIVPASTLATSIIPIQPDADFWCDQIVIRGGNGALKIYIRDVRNGYLLTYPYARMAIFGAAYIAGGLTGEYFPVTPASLPRPYCFTRNGGVEITIDNTVTAGALSVYIALHGWKEFENVSR